MKTTARGSFHEASRAARALSLSVALVALIAWAGSAGAQLPFSGAGAQFDITGFIQTATLDAGDVLAGGTVQVNGHTILVPRNTIFQMPAFAMTWQQLFTLAPAPYGPTQTGLAMADVPTPLTNYEVHVMGNRIGDTYIAGLIFLSQHSLMSGQGFINYLDYANNEMRVGGALGNPSTGTRLRINDPIGRFAPAYTLDTRFTIDTDNPTIRTETGYPMCFPHKNPATGPDPLCPQQNRPVNSTTQFPLTIFTMQPPGVSPGPTTGTNAWVAAPFEVGDHVTYAGNLMKDGPQPSAGPLPANGMAGTYIAAHTIIANVGIFTAPGTNPVYVATDVMLLGVGGLPIAGLAQEATIRTRFEGFTTDPTRNVSLWGMDADACSVATSDRSWGTIDVDQGPPTGAVMGRWRFRPPSKILTMAPAGTFLPATRMMRSAVIGATQVVSTNGLTTGQYAAPIFEFLFPENLGIGTPPVPFNFQDFPFLVNGTWAALFGVNAGQLIPFPTATVPAPRCGSSPNPLPPTANAGLNQTVAALSFVTLDGSLSSDPNGLAVAWAWTPPAGVTLSSNIAAKPTFTAPAAPGVLTFGLIVTNTAGVASLPSSVTVTVNAGGANLPPIANAGAPQTVGAGTTVQLNGTGSADPNVPAQALTFAWLQTAGTPVTFTPGTAATATPTFRTPTPFPAATTLTFRLTVTNTSAPPSTASVNITVNPVVAPIANAGVAQAIGPSVLGTLNGSASIDPNGLPLTYQWTQVGGNAVTLTGAATTNPTFPSPATTPQTLTFQLIVNNGFVASAPAIVQVSVNSVDVLTFTVVEYRTGKQRLTVSVTSSVTNGTPALTLTATNPSLGAPVPMTFLGGGLYTIVLTGVGQPATVTATSSLGGTKTSPVLTVRN